MLSVPEPARVEAEAFDALVPELPNADAVFLVRAGERSAYLAKTAMLRRRLLRILRPGEPSNRGLQLRGIATSVEYWLTGSRFESALLHYLLARLHYPDSYLKLIKLRMPVFVRLLLENQFPRTLVTTRLGASHGVHYGPFRTRAAADLFNSRMLDLFQLRRCQEDLAPSPDHPGCIYGEMNMCLRPCQVVVGEAEYRSEASRVEEFLRQDGRGALQTLAAARDRFSEEMDFEAAARQHQRIEAIEQVVALRDGLACDIDRLYGVAITPSYVPPAVKLWFVCRGCWQPPFEFALASDISLDRRLRDLVGQLKPELPSRQERQEHLALLARWVYSTWSDAEWLPFDSLESAPYRRLVRAISRVAAGRAGR